MAWISLIVAGLCETIDVIMINEFNKKRNWQSLSLLILGFGSSFLFLTFALSTLPMGTAYAIWTGIGATGGAVVGMIFYGESKDWKRITCIAIIISAVIGLKLISS
ncbi:multidrug efflux SMR transporter [Aquibacillus koreensis]|uniref:Multidrug efflux SMR transporter n=1 Tax=Aquibacillus koreensis TaxID=279446 RepID=A0A9X3WRW4_9BACI|nr:multidrug efflux SMR transporter [Aquibacillus koreensis]MDC3422279.1 multidrug efflux SMR transporter [Aquibacillus koreensis]